MVDVQRHWAVLKTKVTITSRFTFEGVEVDSEVACRFFFNLKNLEDEWGFVTIPCCLRGIRSSRCTGKDFRDREERSREERGREVLVDVLEFVLGGHEDRGRGRRTSMRICRRDILHAKCRDWLKGKEVKPDST
jgi:hypothetical protein